jgi:hypothetical protein
MNRRPPPPSEVPANRLPPRSGLLAPPRSRKQPVQEIFEDEPPLKSDDAPTGESPVHEPR